MDKVVSLKARAWSELLTKLFEAYGSNTAEASEVANHLVEADLFGHPSHGSSLVPIYIANIGKGEVTPNQQAEAMALDSDLMLFDACKGFGQSVLLPVMDQVVARACDRGTAVFAVRNAHHIGRVGCYGERMAEANLASIMFVNTVSRPIVAPFGGAVGRMGTNPVCISIPREGKPPMVLDFATSAIAVGKCRVALEQGKQVPEGVVIDAQGNPTRDPAVLYQSPQGALKPMAGHKGAGLNFVCELFAACMGGLIMKDARPQSGSAINSLTGMAFSLDALPWAKDNLEAAVAYYLETPSAAADGPVTLPGTPERLSEQEKLTNGVPMAEKAWSDIVQLGKKVGIAEADFEAILMPGGDH